MKWLHEIVGENPRYDICPFCGRSHEHVKDGHNRYCSNCGKRLGEEDGETTPSDGCAATSPKGGGLG